ncbi:MAG TPA: SDR family NAD(P)-dependent oxidoreductase [Candidatus Saccharimonas sp.]|nr:SDR family NAD(P)-dependent oxidoreductase [Candidatus Saccharimonas sp.]
MNCLIVGGTSGLGACLAYQLAGRYSVIVTGRHDPGGGNAHFARLDLTGDALDERIAAVVKRLPQIDLLVYSAGYYQQGRITDLKPAEVHDMLAVGLAAPILLAQAVLQNQGMLDTFVAVTSTSQWTPRAYEPVYAAVKAGLAHFANSLSLDSHVRRVLVAGPAGMETAFWAGSDKDTSGMLRPDWVANQVIQLLEKEPDFSYKAARILREPARVEVHELRVNPTA